MSRKSICIVVPCFNEELTIHKLVGELNKVKRKIEKHFKLDYLFVNDGSTDNTVKLLNELSKSHSYIFYKSFARNSGHQAALRAGLNHSTNYDAVIMMDADLQHPPEMIEKMLSEWGNGYQIVQMVRNDVDKTGYIKYKIRNSYYSFLSTVGDIKLEYGASDFRLIDGVVTDLVAKSPEKNLFLRGYFSFIPAKRKILQYTPNERFAGTSKYSLKKLLDLAYKGVIQFSTKPLKFAVTFGFLVAGLSFVYGLFLVFTYYIGARQVSGWTSLMVVLLIMFGFSFILTGIVGHYFIQILDIIRDRPEYLLNKESSQITKKENLK